VPGFEGKGWWEFTLIMVLFHEIHSNLMRSPLKYNRFEISNLDLVRDVANMLDFIESHDLE
jgi:hypothetical protein